MARLLHTLTKARDPIARGLTYINARVLRERLAPLLLTAATPPPPRDLSSR